MRPHGNTHGIWKCDNPSCRDHSFWSRSEIEKARAARARLIAEAVKPWRELIADAVRERITDDWLKSARVLLDSESVKTNNEETSND